MIVTHKKSVEPERHPGMELIENLDGFVEENLFLLAPVDQAWQPTDYLPDLTSDDWAENLARFRETAQRVSDDLLVILVGNLVTEEALPNYTVSLEHIARDPTGTTAHALGAMAARVDCRRESARRPAQCLSSAHGPRRHALGRADGPPSDQKRLRAWLGHEYEGLIYASFQERATRITHGNVGKLAAAQGEENLAKICRKIAGDETRHETFYTRVIGEVMERDPEGGVLAYRAMLKGKIAMPGKRMFDGHDPDLYDHFGTVTQRNGAYTFQDYGEIISHLNEAWDIAHLSLSRKGGQGAGLHLPAAGTFQSPGG